MSLDSRVGQVFSTNGGTDCVITEYKGTYKVKIKFLDEYGYENEVAMKELRNGEVKNPYSKSLHGVGFLGEGMFKTSVNKLLTPEYKYWSDMLMRCYYKTSLMKNPSYINCIVCDEWHNFQIFSDWITKHESFGLGYELDKDLLLKGNKLYSPDTCSLIPKEVNMAINGAYLSKGKCKQGVTLRKNGKFQAQISYFGESKYLGCFETEEEAYNAYKESKEFYIKGIADKWSKRISKKSYDALMSWSI